MVSTFLCGEFLSWLGDNSLKAFGTFVSADLSPEAIPFFDRETFLFFLDAIDGDTHSPEYERLSADLELEES